MTQHFALVNDAISLEFYKSW